MNAESNDSTEGPPFIRRWIAGNVAGELLALGATTAVGALVPTALRLDGPMSIELLASLAMLLTGAVEGLLLGSAQAWALAPLAPNVGRRWVFATSLAFVVAWGLGLAASFLEPIEPPSVGLLVLAAFAGGGLLGAVVGAAQAWVIHQLGGDGRAWIGWSTLGWSVALVVTALFSTLAPPGPARVDTFIVAMGGGAATGAVYALITGGAIRSISAAFRPTRGTPRALD